MMDANGFLPTHACKACGRELSGDNSGRPAELYAGTYNGLCYPCTSSAAYVERIEFDGALTWNYPPHCPSWRRDRETFHAYPDCAECSGKGRIMVSRPYPRGGPYSKNCDACFARYFGHPVRRWGEARHRRLYKAIVNDFDRAPATADAAEYRARYYKARDRFTALYLSRTPARVQS